MVEGADGDVLCYSLVVVVTLPALERRFCVTCVSAAVCHVAGDVLLFRVAGWRR